VAAWAEVNALCPHATAGFQERNVSLFEAGTQGW